MTSALVDSASKALLAASDQVAIISFLNDCTLDTYHVPHVDRPNYEGACFTSTLTPEDFPRWSWGRGERRFRDTTPDGLTDELYARAALAQAKGRAIGQIIRFLNIARNRLVTGLNFQDTIYRVKAHEAERFRDSGYDEERILEFPFVLQYAEYAGISLRQAADDIHLKGRFHAHYLLNTEGLRLKFFNRVRQATDPATLPGIADEFYNECFKNVMV